MHRKSVQYLVLTVAAVALGAMACVRHNDTSAIAPKSSAPENANRQAIATDAQLVEPTVAARYTDAQIVGLLDEVNAADSMAAGLAMSKATNEDVRNFAKEMINDHHELRRDGQELVKTLNLTPQFPPIDPVQQAARKEMDVLQTTPAGSAFNRVYVDQEVALHQAVIQLTTDFRAQAQAPALKDLIDKARSVLLKHLGSAQALQQKLLTNQS